MKVSDALTAFNIAKRDAETLLLHCLGRTNRAWLFAHDTDDLTVQDLKQYSALCRAREQGVPLAYVMGYREFWSLELAVSPDVLIPRPETEHLVEWAIERVEASAAPSLLDLGTGSGAIALACKAAKPKLQVTACDVSEPALAVAEKNARNLDLPIELTVSNWFSAFGDRAWSIIVANPPYVAGTDEHLLQGDVRFEPMIALTDGSDGLSDIRRIITQAPQYLTKDGWLLIEHGYDQASDVGEIFRAHGFRDVSLR
ncbi:MAG: peptide chain release factor N(5)-glutamine methyltransferase, partial [Halieaceae bacterium]|nr:peptide chain release factor N(5)-glutamine methyltransferase [Halieaceae bacterium]